MYYLKFNPIFTKFKVDYNNIKIQITVSNIFGIIPKRQGSE